MHGKAAGRIARLALLVLLAIGFATPAALAAAGARQAGTLTFCTDATYPPEEFFQGTKLVGSDIDIATDVAKRLGKTAKFQNTGFDGIIAALLAKKCDAIISGMNCHSVSSGRLENQACSALTQMNRITAVCETRRAPNRSTTWCSMP